MHAVGAAFLGLVVFTLGKILWLLRLCLFAYVAALCIKLYPAYSQFLYLDRFVSWVNMVAQPPQNLLRSNLPTVVGGIDLTPYILLVVAVVIWSMLESRWGRWRMKASSWRVTARRKRRLAKIRKEAHKQVGKIDALSVAVESSNREELLELYAKTKKALDAQEQMLSFLSIDVVGSTSMKENEDAAIASRDFTKYMEMVDRVIKRHDYLKASWTPDGVMICFSETRNAVNAGQDVLRSLDRFNRVVKAMRAEFKVRIGINSGQVLYDERVPMEEMSSRVIDIAGHMQKYAEENSIFINKSILETSAEASNFLPSETKVDGCDVLVWKHV